jgi:pimeloyl-ACP methyl ester carboxylesterase
VHEAAQRANPASRVVYADIDPVAIAHSRAILAGQPRAAIIDADLRQPSRILGHSVTRQLIDFTQPVGLLLVAVLHFIGDAGEPGQRVAELRDALAPGSYLVLAGCGHSPHLERPAEFAAAVTGFLASVPAR